MAKKESVVELNKPVEFIGVTWSEPSWEFDAPHLILSPFIRYGFDSLESMMEDLAIDIAFALNINKEIKDEDVSQEFNWRGWDLEELKNIANNIRENLTMEKYPDLRVVKRKVCFYEDSGNIDFIEVV